MERLLKDAEKLSGVKYDINNLADVYDAIHVIQTELDITGTTAKEASETLSGSMAAMKGAFKNVLGNLSIGGDLKPHLEGLAETVSTFLFGNFIPMLTNVLTALPGAIVTFIQSAAPYFLEGGQNITKSLGDGMTLSIPNLMTSALGLISKLVEIFKNNLGAVVGTGLDIIKNLLRGIMEALPVMIQEVPRIINDFANAIYAQMPQVLKAGFEIIGILAQGLLSAIPTLVANLPQIIMAIVNVMTLYNWAQLGQNMITKLGEGVKSMVSSLSATAKSLASNAIEAIKMTFSDAPKIGKGLVEHLITGVQILAEALFTAAKSLARSALDSIISVFKDARSIGSDMVRGVWEGIKDMGGWFASQVRGFFEGILSSVKSVFGIASPSKVFRDEVGKNMALGVGVGFVGEIKTVTSQITTSMANLGKDAAEAYTDMANFGHDGLTIETPIKALKDLIDGDSLSGVVGFDLGDRLSMRKTKFKKNTDAKTIENDNGMNIYIENVYNSDGRTIKDMAAELDFYRRQREVTQ